MNNEEEQQQEQPGWFMRPEILTAISEMEEAESRELLLELVYSRSWIAILKYIDARYRVIQSGLTVYDPVKDPTTIARCQGMLSGIMDLPEAVSHLQAIVEKANREETEKEDREAEIKNAIAEGKKENSRKVKEAKANLEAAAKLEAAAGNNV